MFVLFNQNNSGGEFHVNEKVCHRLFIEADSIEEAVSKALELGVYFNGVYRGMDCPCCGDRWSCYVDDDDLITYPCKYSDNITFDTVEEHAQHLANRSSWTAPDARIFYKDGKVVEVYNKKDSL